MVSTLLVAIAIFLVNVSSCLCLVPLGINNTSKLQSFRPAMATWYGDATGAGSGGACGWESDVQNPPISAMISAGNANIFLKGKGCGHCFQILCNTPPYCSRKPVTVTITDECPGCNKAAFHFDLSGTAFGAMANPGHEHDLRNLGQLDVQFQRVPCNYGGTKIAFKVDKGCNQYWFAVSLEYADGDGGFKSVEIAAASGGNKFVPMNNLWGSLWKVDIDKSFQGPYSFRLTSENGKTVVAQNVIPHAYIDGQKYSSIVNFNYE